MASRLKFEGLDELRAALRALPAELAAEAGDIVMASAEAAKADIVAAYPRRTGNLADHVYITAGTKGTYGAAVIVKNTAKHAWIFENGTQARHSALGANRGSMPPGHVFIPRMIRYRRAMYDRLKALLVRNGLVVSGDA